jgi:hypothetical protein
MRVLMSTGFLIQEETPSFCSNTSISLSVAEDAVKIIIF